MVRLNRAYPPQNLVAIHFGHSKTVENHIRGIRFQIALEPPPRKLLRSRKRGPDSRIIFKIYREYLIIPVNT